jgi:MFS family permease
VVQSHAEESLGANPGDAALNPADSVAMGVPAARSPQPPAPGRAGTFRALQHRAFRLLFVAFMINQTGFWISHISLQGLMVQLSNNDTRQNGLLFFFLFVPAFVLAPVAGVAADRFDRKRIVLVCYGLVTISAAALALATYTEWMTPPRLLGITFAMGFSFAFSGPASMAIAANSVPKDDLASAVSLQSAANNLTRVAGPLLAAPLLALSRFDISFVLYMIAAAVAAGLTAAMRIERITPDAEEGGIFARMANGLAHARARRPAMPALLTVAVLSFFGVSHTVLIPAYAADVLGSRAYFAWLVAATGLGAMVGALQTGRAGRSPTLRGATIGLIAYGSALSVFAWTSNLAVALIAQLVVGYFYFAVMTSLQTLIQQIVDESKRGRVMSLFQVSWAGLVPFGSLALGFLAGPLGTPATLAGAAQVCGLYGVVMTFLAPRLTPAP